MSWGYYVEIDHGNGYKTLYAHMSSFVVQAGQTVEKGQLIGYVGATGAATGPHCHFEMYYNNALISRAECVPGYVRHKADGPLPGCRLNLFCKSLYFLLSVW